MVTDLSLEQRIEEIVREKIMRQLGDELPYAVTVEIDEFKQKGPTLHIAATVFVERKGQKRILRKAELARAGEDDALIQIAFGENPEDTTEREPKRQRDVIGEHQRSRSSAAFTTIDRDEIH